MNPVKIVAAGVLAVGVSLAIANFSLKKDEKYTFFGELRGRVLVSGTAIIGIVFPCVKLLL